MILDFLSIKKKYSSEELKNRKWSGEINAIHCDHKYSVLQGFKDGILPCIIGNQCNLELIHWKDNIKKLDKCSITKEDLFNLYKLEEKNSGN